MNRDKWICLVTIGLVLLLSPVARAKSDLERDLTDCVIGTLKLDTSRTTIEILKSRFIQKAIDYDSLEIVPMTRALPRGLIPLQVFLYKEGRIILKEQVRVRIAEYQTVLVTTGHIKRNDIITFDKYRKERREVTSLTDKPLISDEELAGKWAKRSINPGQILTSDMIEEIPLIMAGKQVSILFRNPGLQITTLGAAIESGYKGENIKVRNIQSGKTIKGTVLDSVTVAVALP